MNVRVILLQVPDNDVLRIIPAHFLQVLLCGRYHFPVTQAWHIFWRPGEVHMDNGLRHFLIQHGLEPETAGNLYGIGR